MKNEYRVCGKKEFLEWARRQNPLSSGATIVFVGSLRRFHINVRVSDLQRCFFCEVTNQSWTLDEFLSWAKYHTRSIAFDYWQCRVRLPKP